MIRHLLTRVLWSVFVLWAVMSALFVLVHIVGDPAAATLGDKANAAQIAAFAQEHGFDRPIGERYVTYLGDLATLDLGKSFQDQREVTDLIATRLPRTMLLGGLTIFFELAIGLILGTLAAIKQGTWVETATMAVAILGISLPTFVTGLFFLSYFAFRLGLFPVGGYGVDALDHVRHAILPALTLAVAGSATYARLMRGEMVEALRSDYVRTAQAKGLGPLRVIFAHGIRNAILPVITLAGTSLRVLVSGAIITEAIFAWPGMGRLAVEAIAGLDLPVVTGIVFIACIAVLLGNLLADVASALLDPRIRESS